MRLNDFHAFHGWLENFKNRHRLTSLKIASFVSHHQVENGEVMGKLKRSFILEFNEVSSHFKPSEIFNTDHACVAKELHFNRIISFFGEKGLLWLFIRKMLLHIPRLHGQLSHKTDSS